MQPKTNLKQLRNSTPPIGAFADDIARNVIRLLRGDEQSNSTDNSQYSKGRDKVAASLKTLSPRAKKLLGLGGAGVGGGGVLAASEAQNLFRQGYVMGKRGIPIGESIVTIAEGPGENPDPEDRQGV